MNREQKSQNIRQYKKKICGHGKQKVVYLGISIRQRTIVFATKTVKGTLCVGRL